MQKKIILSLQDVKDNPSLENKVGGKFFGLCEAARLLEKCSVVSGMNIRVPQSWVISSKVFDNLKPPIGMDVDNYFDNLVIPNDIINQCKHILVLCGGRVALRSSSNIEDAHNKDNSQIKGKTYSGAFDTLLDVKISDIREGLKTIYKSLYNPVVMNNYDDIENLKMSIIVQEMISKPKFSGVIYSKAFDNDKNGADAANSIIHYVEDSTAENMIVGADDGLIKRVPKFMLCDNEKDFSLCGIDVLEKNNAYRDTCFSVKSSYINDSKNYERAFKNLAFMQLSSLVNHFEQKLGHAVDMEFAVTADSNTGMPVINVLQQRPYWEVDNFKIRNYNNELVTGYDEKNGPEIEGEVVVIEAPDPMRKDFDDIDLPDMNGKIVLMRRQSLAQMQEKYPDANDTDHEFYLARTIMLHSHLIKNELYQDSKAIIDTSGYLLNALYGHYGNELRRNGVPFVIAANSNYDELESGNQILLNAADGRFKTKKQRFNGTEKSKTGTKKRTFSAYFNAFFKNKVSHE